MTQKTNSISADDTGFRKLMQRRAIVLRYLFVASGVARDPVLILVLFSSLSRAALIFSIN